MHGEEPPDQVNQLCRRIRDLSKDGTTVTWGVLARDKFVTQTFKTLLGTLKVARKRKLVKFTGELLLMGHHDDVEVALTDADGEQRLQYQIIVQDKGSAAPPAPVGKRGPSTKQEQAPRPAMTLLSVESCKDRLLNRPRSGTSPAPNTKLERASERAANRVGRLSVEGRYHRLPNRLADLYECTDRTLGSGYNGVVRMVKHRGTGKNFAVKGFKLSGVSSEKMKELTKETEIFLGMDHPHVARLVDVFEEESELFLVMECMEGGELFDRVQARKFFSEEDALDASRQMFLAVKYLHDGGVVHRDIKLENFLYERKDTDFLKLIDFGFSKVWDMNVKMECCLGTLAYAAPEVLNRSYTSQCDLWSLGVTVFILLVGYMPFGGTSEAQQIQAIKTGNYHLREERWSRVSAEAFDFVKKLLVVDPQVRLTAKQALEHPWLAAQSSGERLTRVDTGMAEALLQFARESHFRRACMSLMAWSLTAEERSEVRGAFLKLDVNHTGTIKLSEFKGVLEDNFYLTGDEASRAFEALDTNGDQEINYSEFLAAMMSGRMAMHDDLLQATFQRFDVENTGFITRENLKQVLGSDADVDSIIQEVDKNSDGKISHREFIAHLRNHDLQERTTSAISIIIDREFQERENSGSLTCGSPVNVRKRSMFSRTVTVN